MSQKPKLKKQKQQISTNHWWKKNTKIPMLTLKPHILSLKTTNFKKVEEKTPNKSNFHYWWP